MLPSKQLCIIENITEKDGGQSACQLTILPAGRQCVNIACMNFHSADNICLLLAVQGSSGTTTNELLLLLKWYSHSQHTRAAPAIVRRRKKMNIFGRTIFSSLFKLLRHTSDKNH